MKKSFLERVVIIVLFCAVYLGLNVWKNGFNYLQSINSYFVPFVFTIAFVIIELYKSSKNK